MTAVVQMTYRPADPRLPHAEVLDFDDLRKMNCGITQRCDFLVLAMITAGRGSISIDFAHHALTDGSILWVPPGAVHRWIDFDQVQGRLVLCQPSSPLTAATRALVTAPRSESVLELAAEDEPYVMAAVEHLALETRPEAPVVSAELTAALLTALLCRLPRDPQLGRTDSTFDAFRRSIETGFHRHRDVAYYATRLGYSERTLTRSALAATGRTAKHVIAERVVLEAKRLLAHHGLSAAACARTLGFPDPSAFSNFFRRVTGVRPGAWLTAQIGTAPDASVTRLHSPRSH